ncbi:hypothetical protein [Neobacillus sp. Marseille-QA0830]
MKLNLSKKNNIIIAIAALVIVLLIVYAQFFMLSPLKTDLETKQQTLDSEKKLLEVVTKKQQDTSNKVVESTRELQKKLPIKPLQEEIILDLEKAETVSSSQILSMGFSQDGTVTVENTTTTTENTNAQQATTEGQATEQTQQDTTTQSESTNQAETTDDQAAQTTTPAIKKLTVQLSVESPSYTEFEKFVDTLEALNRIVVVEAINYSGGKEITDTLTETENQKLAYTLTVSAFYMPDLADLEVDVPKIDAPAPAGKDNPLFQFPSVTTPTIIDQN